MQENPSFPGRPIVSLQHILEHQAMREGIEYSVLDLSSGSESSVFVIRKQLRKLNGSINTHAVYYITGENIYQAPSVQCVLQTRTLQILSRLRNALRVASELGSLLPVEKKNEKDKGAGNAPVLPNSTQNSIIGAYAPGDTSDVKTAEVINSATMLRALGLAFKHRDDHMDDHAPLLGDPGSLLAGAKTDVQVKRVCTPDRRQR